ncbi:FMN-dependent NADH-azoreductase [Priestia taiwanensis]|nr:FMN-dependent NADH-azoreductase [Priestia taiwanensis]
MVVLDLYKQELPYMGVDMINGTFKAVKGFDLTTE